MAGLALAMASGAESVGDRLHKGIYQEETVGDLDAAMKIYQEIVADEKANRPHAARAKYRLGMCHVKKGENEKAVGTFEGLIKEFPGQANLLEQARGQLAALGHAPESEEPAGVELQEVWSFSGLDNLNVTAISRDGRYCAFADSETGALMIRDLTSGEDRRLTEPTAGRRIAAHASISRDNKWVVYPEYAGGECSELRIVGTDGSGRRVLYANEEKNHIGLWGWGPESQYVLATFRDPGVASQGPATYRIVAVSVTDGSIKVLKEITKRNLGNPSPKFSPDGRYVAYHRRTDEDSSQCDVFLVPLDGGEEIHLIEHPAPDLVLGWIPDSQNLLFLGNRGGEGWQTWMIRVVDGRPQGAPRQMTKGVVSTFWCNSSGPVRTPTGGWAFYYRESIRAKSIAGVYVAALDLATGKLLGDPEPVLEPTAGRKRAWSPDFSHDGKYLAYYVVPFPKKSPEGLRYAPGNIVIRTLETGQEREITLSPKLSGQGLGLILRWAPDGRSMVCHGRAENGRAGLYRVDVDTGNVDPLVLEAPELTKTDWQLRWDLNESKSKGDCVGLGGELSPDGKTLFFKRTHYDPNAPPAETITRGRIVARDLETDREREIYRNPDGVFGGLTFGLSPDGERVFVVSGTMLRILTTAAGEPRELLKMEKESLPISVWNSNTSWTFAWTGDSRHLLFVRVEQGRSELWRISAEGGKLERIGKLPADLGAGSLRVDPKGRHVGFFGIPHPRSRIRMMQITVSGELAKEMCTANLTRIGKAIEQYKNDHGDVPDGVADLYPDYLQNTDLLLCPADHSGGRPLEGAKDPKMRCSYRYVFGPGTEGVSGDDVALPVDFPAREGMTWKDARKLQMEYFGPVVPVVQCGHHRRKLFLRYDGEVMEATRPGISWWGPPAMAGLLRQLESAMESEPAAWAQRYDMQRFYLLCWWSCVALRGGQDESAAYSEAQAPLTKLLKTHLERHPEDKAAREFLAELPGLRFSDDSREEVDDGSVESCYHLELGEGKDKVVGIWFSDIPVPQGARIKRAYVQFTAHEKEPSSEKTDLVLHAELAANAEMFANVKHNITSRSKTAASVEWSPEPWTVPDERSRKQRTPDLSSLIQEVVNQPDWQKGNALVLIISGSGRRNAQSDWSNAAGCPTLYVEH